MFRLRLSIAAVVVPTVCALSIPGLAAADGQSAPAATPSGPGQAAPDFGPNVLVFDPSMTKIQSQIDEVFRQQERSQFGPNRYALLFKPGKCDLDVQVGFYTQVLGLGYPTLQPQNGTAAMVVADDDGVKLAGILFEAGPANSETLLQIGEPGSSASHAKDPLFLHDIFCRAGGALAGQATCFLTIHSNNVVGDNFWLWRADHCPAPYRWTHAAFSAGWSL